MKTHKILGIVAFVLSLIGGAIVAIGSLNRMSSLSLESFLFGGLELLFALGAIFGGWLIYIGLRKMGGLITLITGIVILALAGGFTTYIAMIIIGGALGLVAAQMKPWWAFWR